MLWQHPSHLKDFDNLSKIIALFKQPFRRTLGKTSSIFPLLRLANPFSHNTPKMLRRVCSTSLHLIPPNEQSQNRSSFLEETAIQLKSVCWCCWQRVFCNPKTAGLPPGSCSCRPAHLCQDSAWCRYLTRLHIIKLLSFWVLLVEHQPLESTFISYMDLSFTEEYSVFTQRHPRKWNVKWWRGHLVWFDKNPP